MELSVSQIQELIKNPTNRTALLEAVSHEDRVKLHTKAVDSKHKASGYFLPFIDWVKNGIGLPSDKMKAFEGMCQFPLATTALCNSIFDEFEKIFTAQDHYFDVQLLDDSLKADYEAYLKELKVHRYFETKGFEEFKKQPCSIYVVDMPAVQFGLRPEPFFTKISIKKVVDVGVQRLIDGSQRIGYLIYRVSEVRIVAIDDLFYRLFERENTTDQWRMTIESPHTLGYAPAKFLLSTSLYDEDDNSPVARKAPISDSLGDLDWLLAYKVFERMYETYGPFPITTVPETECSYVDGLENRCTSGYVTGIRDGKPYSNECPACKKNNLVGPGSIFARPVPRVKEDPQLGNAVEFTPADVASLDYITKKIDYLEREIFANNVGDTDQTISKEAINEDQVQANVEGKRNVLLKIKKDFEQTEKFIVDTIGRLMFGDYYVSCTVNYGEKFLLFSAEEVALQYADYKKAGLPAYLVSQKKQQLIQTEFHSNPYEQQRSAILDLLEPWPDMSISECVTFQLNNLFPDKFYLKLDFAKFVSKFELANLDIVQWGAALPLKTKIDKLTQILLEYGKVESSSAKPLPEAKPAGGFK